MDIPAAIADEIDVLPAVTTVFAAGSMADGTQHATSDFDLIGVLDDAVTAWEHIEALGDHWNTATTFQTLRVPVIVRHSSGQRWDIELWPLQALDALSETLRQEDLSKKRQLSHGDVDFLCRLSTGIPLRSPNGFDQMLEKIPFDVIQRVLIRRFVYSAEDRIDDAVGLLRAGSPKESAVQAREAFGFLVDVELARSGDLSLSKKRRLLRLSRVAEKSRIQPERFWEVESMTGVDSSADWARDLILEMRRSLAEYSD